MSQQLTAAEAQQHLTALQHLALSRCSLLSTPRHAALHAQRLLCTTHPHRSLLWGSLVTPAETIQRRLPSYFEQHSPTCKACATPLVPGITSYRTRSGKQCCSSCNSSSECSIETKPQFTSLRQRRKLTASIEPAAPHVVLPHLTSISPLQARTLETASNEPNLKKTLPSATLPSTSRAQLDDLVKSSDFLAAQASTPALRTRLDDHLGPKKPKSGSAKKTDTRSGTDKAVLRAMLASSKRKLEHDTSEAHKKRKGGGLMDFLGAL